MQKIIGLSLVALFATALVIGSVGCGGGETKSTKTTTKTTDGDKKTEEKKEEKKAE